MSMGSIEVEPGALRAAAARLRSATSPLVDYDFPEEHVTPTSFGHVELAAWFLAVVDQCDKAGQALGAGGESLAGRLAAAADDFTATDQGVASGFRPGGTAP
ncbi:hypothetical protein ACFP3Q_06195 [Nocardioides sp. GCM10027113]|uniref:hypothetical protein n=1 Tax=unclassified Nocardioides TaxID=2615069 RepID=UPI0036220885